MEYTSLLLRCGELFLKGKNLPLFERALRDNIRIMTGQPRVTSLRGRLIMPYFDHHRALCRVFGLVSYSPARKVPASLDAIQEASLRMLAGKQGTFKIEPKRSDKRFPLTSPELNVALGKFIEANTGLRFDGLNPEHILGVEINQDGAYLFDCIVPGFGGLPTGVEGKVAVLLEDEAGVLAGLLFMKRGCAIVPVSLRSECDISLLQKFSPQQLNLTIFKDEQEIEQFVNTQKLALVCGETFGTLSKSNRPDLFFRPLIAYSESEIQQQLAVFSA